MAKAKNKSAKATNTSLVIALLAIVLGLVFVTNFGDTESPVNDGSIMVGSVLLLVGGLMTGMVLGEGRKSK